MKELEMVAQFHLKYNIPILPDGKRPKKDRIELRKALMWEETKELIEAHNGGNIIEIAKESADLLYIVLGAVLEFGQKNHFQEFVCTEIYQTELFNDGATESIEMVCDFVDELIESKSIEVVCDFLDRIFYDLEEYIRFNFNKEQFDKVFQAVHESNMGKGTNGVPVYSETGKILKGDDYKAPDLSFLNQSPTS